MILAVAAPNPGLLAQGSMERLRPPSVQTIGEASVMAKPDQAQVDIGVVTEAQSADAAASQNARQLETVLGQLKKILGPKAEIRTVSFAITPNYNRPREGQQASIMGYTATNILQVTTGDLLAVGKVVDAATGSGANSIRRLHFTLKDEQQYRAEALRQAANKAKSNAEAIATALGLKIVRILQVEEGGSGEVHPVREMAMAAAMRAPTPIEAGTIEVHARVSLTAEVAP